MNKLQLHGQMTFAGIKLFTEGLAPGSSVPVYPTVCISGPPNLYRVSIDLAADNQEYIVMPSSDGEVIYIKRKGLTNKTTPEASEVKI